MDRNLLKKYVEEILVEAAVKSSQAAQQGLGLIVSDSGRTKALVLFNVKAAAEAVANASNAGVTEQDKIMDALEKTVVGYINLISPGDEPQWGAHKVTAAAAEKGYGPLMYDIAMSMFGPITSDRHSVSPSAERIWSYYAKSRSDVEKLPFDDIDDPKTPNPKDDAKIYKDKPHSPLNAAYEGAEVNTSTLQKNAAKWIAWASKGNIPVSTIQKAIKYAGSGFFRQKYLHSED